jgi:hypothetical protein
VIDEGFDASRALGAAARTAGVELGEITPTGHHAVTMAADRGLVHVSADREQRRFRIYLWHGERLAAAGATAEVSEVVTVTDCWRRGALLRELTEWFPFLEHTRLARAPEDGERGRGGRRGGRAGRGPQFAEVTTGCRRGRLA